MTTVTIAAAGCASSSVDPGAHQPEDRPQVHDACGRRAGQGGRLAICRASRACQSPHAAHHETRGTHEAQQAVHESSERRARAATRLDHLRAVRVAARALHHEHHEEHHAERHEGHHEERHGHREAAHERHGRALSGGGRAHDAAARRGEAGHGGDHRGARHGARARGPCPSPSPSRGPSCRLFHAAATVHQTGGTCPHHPSRGVRRNRRSHALSVSSRAGSDQDARGREGRVGSEESPAHQGRKLAEGGCRPHPPRWARWACWGRSRCPRLAGRGAAWREPRGRQTGKDLPWCPQRCWVRRWRRLKASGEDRRPPPAAEP